MSKLAKHGKGIILMHDFQHATSEAVPEMSQAAQGERLQGRTGCRQDAGRAAAGIQGDVLKEMGGGLDEARPMSSVIQTIQGN